MRSTLEKYYLSRYAMPMSTYDPTAVESKWQKKWEEEKVYEIDLKKAKDKYYSMVMFPYPSGDRLHVGHWYNFGPADSFSRFMRMQGKTVFTPIGFDAFGLPAENYAIKTGIHPSESIAANTETMTKQLKRIGCMYDWSKTVNTSKPEYYRWTQWLFLQMFKNDLAYRKEQEVNFCPKCQTVLANEQCQDGTCERCDTEVVQKPMTQWFWKITDYAQRLLDNHEKLDWPEKTIAMQHNWIGRSEGVDIKSKVKDLGFEFEVYDSVPQTFMAQTFTVIAPEHPMVKELVKGTDKEKEVMEFVERIKKLKATEKFNFDEHLEGVFTGRYVEDPFGTGDLPIWVASFVVMDYGTGIVHCSAHDERDFAFAKQYDIPLRPVMFPDDPKEAEKIKNLEYCYCKDPNGVMQKPDEFVGRKWGEVRGDIIDFMSNKMKIASPAIHYRLRDWSISRQRYWGAPIPIVYDPEGNPHPIPEEHLPWELPTDVEFKPTGTSPLAESKEFIERTEKIFGEGWRPEFDTMDTFVCSSFYQFRYLAEGSEKELVPKDIEKKWIPADMYIGGPEHACMHLIYARFVTMALKDFGLISNEEPFQRLIHQGLITNQGAKMSKSKGNVVSPDEFVDKYGSDVFRMYLMFMGPFTDGGDWSDTGIKGIDRFVQRIWRLYSEKLNKKVDQFQEVTSKLHATIKRAGEDIERLHFNTALSAYMELLNVLEKQEGFSEDTAQTFAKLLAPVAPHIAEELWEMSGGKGFVIDQTWPSYDESQLITDTITIVVQVNGKVRGEFTASPDISEADAILQAKKDENVKKHLDGKEPKKEIFVKGKLVSFVV